MNYSENLIMKSSFIIYRKIPCVNLKLYGYICNGARGCKRFLNWKLMLLCLVIVVLCAPIPHNVTLQLLFFISMSNCFAKLNWYKTQYTEHTHTHTHSHTNVHVFERYNTDIWSKPVHIKMFFLVNKENIKDTKSEN